MIIYQIYKKLLTMKLIIIFLLFNVLFSFYDVGDTISTDDQQIQANICSGSHPLVPVSYTHLTLPTSDLV